MLTLAIHLHTSGREEQGRTTFLWLKLSRVLFPARAHQDLQDLVGAPAAPWLEPDMEVRTRSAHGGGAGRCRSRSRTLAILARRLLLVLLLRVGAQQRRPPEQAAGRQVGGTQAPGAARTARIGCLAEWGRPRSRTLTICCFSLKNVQRRMRSITCWRDARGYTAKPFSGGHGARWRMPEAATSSCSTHMMKIMVITGHHPAMTMQPHAETARYESRIIYFASNSLSTLIWRVCFTCSTH